MTRWFAVQAQPRREKLAQQHLHNQGFATFCPMQRRARKIGKRVQTLLEPFFPGYLFVRIDTARQRWRSINGTIGVSRLVCFGEGAATRPTPLPVGLVERFLAHGDADGVLRFDETLAVGDSVRIVGGPFDSLCGVLERAPAGERVTILLQVLSGATRVAIDRGQVMAA